MNCYYIQQASWQYLDGGPQVVIVHRGQINSREQVTQDAIEQGNVLIQKLGQVDIIDGTQHEHIFSWVWEGTLQVAGSTQNTHDSSHAVIIVVLATKLLTAKPATSKHVQVMAPMLLRLFTRCLVQRIRSGALSWHLFKHSLYTGTTGQRGYFHQYKHAIVTKLAQEHN